MITLTQAEKDHLLSEGNAWGFDGEGNEVAILLYDENSEVSWNGEKISILGSPSDIRNNGGTWKFIITQFSPQINTSKA